jgi:drug/metabolite transporter superfamily protein YnfA
MMHFGFLTAVLLITILTITGFYLLALWAKNNLQKKNLLIFALSLIAIAIVISFMLFVSSYKKFQYREFEDTELIKMKELLSIE